MLRKFPSHRLFEFGMLPASDRDMLHQMAESVRRYPRKTVIRSEGDVPDAIYLLQEGWVASSQSAADGKDHIVGVHLPGDVLGSASACLDAAADTLTSITPVSFRKLAMRHFAHLFATSPTFAAAVFLAAQRDRIALMDRLHSCATNSSLGKLAVFLTDIHDRLTGIGLAQGNTFAMPMTQMQIGQVLGVSTIQVHRGMNELEKRGLVERHSHGITLLDQAGLNDLGPARRRPSDPSAGQRFAGQEVD
jgi:CRP-like cAMP-binding protein